MPRPKAAVGGISLIACDNVEPDGAFGDEAPADGPVMLAIGPERGWSDMERRQLSATGFKRLSLGNRALRTETACAAAVSALETAKRAYLKL
jgi:16S rRNA U1498 N3-methylase RsmE